MAQGSTIVVLGFGVTGQSVARHLLAQGHDCVVCDTRTQPDAVADEFAAVKFYWSCSGWPSLAPTSSPEFAVLSPGLSLDSELVRGARAAHVRLLSDIDLFFRQVSAPVIGITGTNGKSTVTSLVGHLLNQSGVSCGVGGNLGDAALDIIDSAHAAYVLELSSFQLERSAVLPLEAATILNVTDDHLDVHGDMPGYVASKQRIYAGARTVVFNRADEATKPSRLDHTISFGLDTAPSGDQWGLLQRDGQTYIAHGQESIICVDELPLSGSHNHLNVLAACALVAHQLSVDDLVAGLRSFRGLAHRFECVGHANGVTYINDSKATNVGATTAALFGLPVREHVVLIAGGDAKGADLSPLADVLRNRVRHVFCLGKDGAKIAQVSADAGVPHTMVENLADAVRHSVSVAQQGDMVLLSPACASLDMFTNYIERGQQFVDCVYSNTAVARGAC